MKNEWNFKPLNEVVEILDKKRKPINSKQRSLRILGKSNNELYPYYGATGQVGVIDDYLFDGKYVLLGEDGAPFLDAFADKAYIISGKSWVNNHAHILRSNYNNKFLCYYLNCFNYKDYVSGTTRLKLTQADMKRIPVPVPTISEQKQIVQQIEERLSQLDSAIETLQKTKQQLEVYRDTVLKSAFTGSYPSKPLAEISKAISGYAFKSKLYDNSGRYRVVKIGNVKNYHFDFSRDNTRTNEFDERIIEKYLLKHGDCVITLTGSRGKRDYGFVAMINDENDYMLNQRVAALRFDISVAYPKFFMYYLSSIDYRNKFFSYETGNVGQGNVGIKVLIEPEVLVPSLQEQMRIVKRIESQLSVCDSIEQTVNQSLQQAEALRQSILKQAFEG